MKYLLLTFDLEEFVTPAEMGMNVSKKKLFDISLLGFRNLVKLLTKYPKVKATFFTTVEFAEYAKDELRKLMESGHELALHGLYHNIRISKVSREDAKEELLKAKGKLETMFKIKICGFRSPQMATLDLNILKEIGIKYDSSSHPTYVPGKYNNFFKQRGIHFNGVCEVPVSVTPFVRMPFSWVWFRNLGLNYAKMCTKLVYIDQDYVNLYFHPWDFVDINISPFSGRVSKIILRNSGSVMIKKFDKYLNWCGRKFKSVTVRQYLHEHKQLF